FFPLLFVTLSALTVFFTLSLHDALPILGLGAVLLLTPTYGAAGAVVAFSAMWWTAGLGLLALSQHREIAASSVVAIPWGEDFGADRKSTRLNSSHEWISYAVFCLKKKNE